jgi:aspartate/methionine/tyrosine aminotransferase
VLTFGLGGISKMCGLPQLKLGWIAVSGPEAVRREALAGLEWIADLFLSVASPVQVALPRLLDARHGWQARVRERLAGNLASLQALTRRRPALTLAPGAGGWVIPLRVPGPSDAETWALALLERDVVVHPGHFYDFAEEGYLVLSLLVAPRDFERGLERLETLLVDAERAGELPPADPARMRSRR